MDVEQAPPQPRCLDCGHHQLNHGWLIMLASPCNWRGCGCPNYIGQQQQPPQVEFTIACPECGHLANVHVTGYGCKECANLHAKDRKFKVCERKQ